MNIDKNKIYETKFYQELEKLAENPENEDKIKEFIESNLSLITPNDAEHLPQIKNKLLSKGVDVHSPVILKMEEIWKHFREGPSIHSLPKEMKEQIFLQANTRLQETNKQFRETLKLETQKKAKFQLDSRTEAKKEDYSHYAREIFSSAQKCDENLFKTIIAAGDLVETLDLAGSRIQDDQLIEIFKACPNLKTLNLTDCHELTEKSLSKFPQNLERIAWFDCDNEKLNTLIPSLPKNLKELAIGDLGIYDLTMDFNDNFFDQLPENLTTLTLYGIPLTKEELEKFTKNLQELKIYYAGHIGIEEFIATLPRDLKVLRLSGEAPLTDKEIKKLPPNLEELYVDVKLRESAMKHLPENLKVLSIAECPLTNEEVRDLPRSVIKLHVGNAPNLTDECIKDLPPNLREFSGEAPITKEAFKKVFPDCHLLATDGKEKEDIILGEYQYLLLRD